MVVSLVYLLFRRALAVAALRPRSREFKELEIVVLRHELAVLRRQVARPRLEETDRVFLAAASRLLSGAGWQSFFVRPETLLGWHRQDPPRGRDVSCRCQSSALLERVPAGACPVDDRVRFLHRRDVLARTSVCALLHRAWHSACASRWLHGKPGWVLGGAAGAPARMVALGTSGADPLPNPRPRQQVQPRLRRCLPKRGRQDHPHTVPGAERERVRRTLGRYCPARLPRLDPDRKPQTARVRPPRLRRPLQRTQAAPSARPETANTGATSTSRQLAIARPDPPTRPTRRTHPRIRPSSVTDGFTHPTRFEADEIGERLRPRRAEHASAETPQAKGRASA